MRLTKARTRFWLDLALLVAFLLTLAPKITGVQAHQWLSIAMTVGVMAHLATHWHWISAVLKRFLRPIPLRVRSNVLVDSLLFVGSGLLLVSGILMSPNLSPRHTWWAKTVHDAVWAPFTGLMALHLALHWQWILSVGGRYLLGVDRKWGQAMAAATAGLLDSADRSRRRLSRRRFLLLGAGMAATLLTAGVYVARAKSRDTSETETTCPFGLVDDPYPGRCERYTDAGGNGICDLSEQAQQARGTPPAAAERGDDAVWTVGTTSTVEAPPLRECLDPLATPNAALPTSTLTSSAEQNLSTGGVATATPVPDPGPVACPFGLVNDPFPGRCGRYTDRNGNGHCDLSEPGSGTRRS
jgi:hypothetical protein